MNTLDPTTISLAGPIMANAIAKRWPEDRPEVVDAINKYRETLYNAYATLKLFDASFHCICISTFRARCSPCEPCYQGFTLPSDVASLETVWIYGRPLILRSRWRESHTGIDHGCGPRLEVIEMSEQFPTERGLKEVTRLRVYTEREEDAGKKVTVEVTDVDGKDHTLSFTLVSDGWAEADVLVSEIHTVSLPSRVGAITLAQENGYELSVYQPYELPVPQYRRYKLASSNCPATVLVQGVKKFVPLYFDSDVIEIGSRLAMESFGRYLRYGEVTTESKDIQRSRLDLEDMWAHVRGIVARHRGASTQDGTPFKGRKVSPRHTLPGYRR